MYVAFYAALWDTPSTPRPEYRGRREVIRRGAFAEALADGGRIDLRINHRGAALASTGPDLALQLRENGRGLLAVAWIADDAGGLEILAGVMAGRVGGASFLFNLNTATVAEVNDAYLGPVCRLDRVRDLIDVSLIAGAASPAYPATAGFVRAWPN